MVLTTLSINVTSAQAVTKQVKISANNESYSQEHQISNSTNARCYWIGTLLVCK